MDKLFYPRSIAVIGASDNPTKLGHDVMRNLCSTFSGSIHPVSLKEEMIMGMKCARSILEIEEDLDLALILVPADFVPHVMEECVKKKVRFAIVMSGGFSETGKEGAVLEKKISEIARHGGMRVVGPNCIGVINSDTGMNASFTLSPKKGSISMIFQSGALGSSVIYTAINENIGINKFASIGNMCDLEFSDFVSYLQEDSSTKVTALYIEGLKDGKKFVRALSGKKIKKPVFVLKAGNTSEGRRAISSHTGSLAGNERIYGAAFRQTGLLQVETMTELLDASRAFLGNAIEGKRIAIMTNAGGPAIIAVDFLERHGLALAELSEKTKEHLAAFLPPFASLENPIDMIASARREQYKRCIEALEEDENVDGILAINVIPTFAGITQSEHAEGLVEGYGGKKPLVACVMSGEISEKASRLIGEAGIVCYPSPERAVFALGKQLQFSRMKEKAYSEPPEYAFDRESIEKIFSGARKEGRNQLLEYEAKMVLEASGFRVPPFMLAGNLSTCLDAARKIGYPVALKISSKTIVHKTDVGGVRLQIRNEEELRCAYEDMMGVFDSSDVLVNKMAEEGTEMIIGATDDPQFGPSVMCGFGGIFVEAVGDASFRIAPLSRENAEEMIDELRSSRILFGLRGRKKRDMDALIDSMLRLSSLVTGFHEIAEVDMNPLIVHDKGEGASVVDARMTIHA